MLWILSRTKIHLNDYGLKEEHLGKLGRLIPNLYPMYRLSNDSQKLLGQPMFKVLAKVQELEKR